MNKIIYTNVDVLLEEGNKQMIINQAGERFYGVECWNQDIIYRNATVSLNEELGQYTIEGTQTFYSEHKDMGASYEKLLCLHPKELIVKKSFLWMPWYIVSGVMTREIRTLYTCKHKEYVFSQRIEILSCEINHSS